MALNRRHPRLSPGALLMTLFAGLGLVQAEDAPLVAAATIPLWSDAAPGESGTAKPETDVMGKDHIRRIGDVSQPTISFYPAPKLTSNGTSVVICPGGGYSILAMDLEGTEVASWLNSFGVGAIILKYRVPRRTNQPFYLAPVQDGQRAISLVRAKAQEWGLKSDRIGILGFSAGGHLAAVTSNSFANRLYAPRDANDQISCRPDFTVLLYPAYLISDGKLNPEVATAPDAPPAFLVFANDDKLGSENVIAYYLGLKSHNIPAELHIYAKGGHGFGLRPTANPCSTWPLNCRLWMVSQGMVSAPAAAGPHD